MYTGEKLKVRGMAQVAEKPTLMLNEVLERHAKVFKEELDLLKDAKVKTQVDKEAPPKFYKARPISYVVKPLIEQELQRLLEEKIIHPVQFSEWAAPIVPMVKPDGSI
ncbi:hypothetical protein MHYP_G00188100 [Metynnis hypsauchen]